MASSVCLSFKWMYSWFIAFLLENCRNLDMCLHTCILSIFVTFYKVWVAHHVKQPNGWVSDGQGPRACALEEETEGQGLFSPEEMALDETLLQPAPIYGKVDEKM